VCGTLSGVSLGGDFIKILSRIEGVVRRKGVREVVVEGSAGRGVPLMVMNLRFSKNQSRRGGTTKVGGGVWGGGRRGRLLQIREGAAIRRTIYMKK